MADFLEAYNHIIKNEKGYSNDKYDKGGETYLGISRVYNPNWSGWQIIDSIKKEQKIKRAEILKNEPLEKAVQNFYIEIWDKKLNGSSIPNQEIANYLFDFYIHKPNLASKAMRTVIKDTLLTPKIVELKQYYNVLLASKPAELSNEAFIAEVKKIETEMTQLKTLVKTGNISKTTSFLVDNIQNCSEDILKNLHTARVSLYKSLNSKRYIKGWLNRANSMYSLLTTGANVAIKSYSNTQGLGF